MCDAGVNGVTSVYKYHLICIVAHHQRPKGPARCAF